MLAFMMDLDREPSGAWAFHPRPATTKWLRPVDGPVYEATSVGSDHNMIVMSTMKRIAHQHDLMFLAHEKPFVGINGSGKHNNWSMATDDGENLLDPGHNRTTTPSSWPFWPPSSVP